MSNHWSPGFIVRAGLVCLKCGHRHHGVDCVTVSHRRPSRRHPLPIDASRRTAPYHRRRYALAFYFGFFAALTLAGYVAGLWPR